MSKLVCESLDEFKLLNEADDNDGGAITGAAKNIGYAVKAVPGRALRWVRAKAIIKKYENVIPKRIEKTFEKYLPNIEKLVKNIAQRHDAVKSSGADESVKKNQIQDILKDGVDHMQEVLKTVKDAMEGQLKVYADSIGDRLERTGTLTNVKFTPQQKRGLQTMWRSVEDEAHKLMQEKFIKLMSDPKIVQFQELKAQMDAYIEQIRWNRSGFDFDNDKSDKTILTDQNEINIYNEIINTDFQNTKLEFDKPYPIKPDIWRKTKLEPRPASTKHVGFVIDDVNAKVSYVFYDTATIKGITKFFRSRNDKKLYHFIDEIKGENLQNAQEKLKEIMTAIQ